MCRSIKTLRPPVTIDPGAEDIRAAALQYVRKITGFREPSQINREAFWRAVDEIAQSTETVLATLVVRGS